jgi:hypothetical protein
LHDPDRTLFNALESCVAGPQEKTVRKLVRESLSRKLNNCNIQMVGNEHELIELLKEIKNSPNSKRNGVRLSKKLFRKLKKNGNKKIALIMSIDDNVSTDLFA